MRIIDADELLKEIKEYEDGCKMLKLDVDPRVIKQHIMYAPTVDPWHYPSKGEYPTEKDRQYFCKVKDCREEWYEVVGWGDFWLLDEFNQVVAWQYFVPPKEEGRTE